MVKLYSNNFSTTLNGAITDSATTITLTDASGLPAGLPTPPAGTWDSGDLSGITLSGDDFIATKSSGARAGAGAVSAVNKTSGAWYVEFVVNTATDSNTAVGISPKSSDRTVDLGQTADTYAYRKDGSTYFDTAFSGGGTYTTYTSADVIGLAYDIDNNTIEFFKNNVSQGEEAVTLDSGTGYAPAMSAGLDGQQVTIVTDSASQTYSPPAGFTALETTSTDDAYITIDDNTNVEIVLVTLVDGNDITVTRAQQSTTAQSFADGVTVELRTTKEAFEDVLSGDTNPQLRGDLDLNGHQITSPDGTDLIDIPDGSIDLQTNSTSRLDVSDTGVRLGGANARVTTVLDEDAMTSDSATALATQQSIKAYSDTKIAAVTSTDNAVVRYDGTSGAVQNSAVIIDDSNNVTGVGTLTTTGNIATTGISFDSGTNTLSEYEEGTWTVGLQDNSGNASATTATGNYKRIGNVVHVSFDLLNIDTTGLTGTDRIRITGLPFATGSTNATFSFIAPISNLSSPSVVAVWFAASAVTYFNVIRQPAHTDVLVSELSSGVSDVRTEFFYFV